MDIFQTKRDENNMMETGIYCLNDGKQMEQVTGEIRYTCHFCGSVWEIERENGKVKTVQVIFEGH